MFRLPPSPPRTAALACLAVIASAGLAGEALAQANLRSTFPGRRVGGGTRGICTSRPLAHLVPTNSVFAPGATPLLGVLEGPTTDPRPVRIEFRSLGRGGTPLAAAPPTAVRTLPASPAGVTLFPAPALKGAAVWESSYQCGTAASSATPLAFTDPVAPPAVSLLLSETTAADRTVQQELQALRQSCGKDVSRTEVARAFGLADVVTTSWPTRLPVRCL